MVAGVYNLVAVGFDSDTIRSEGFLIFKIFFDLVADVSLVKIWINTMFIQRYTWFSYNNTIAHHCCSRWDYCGARVYRKFTKQATE